tara:strand:+ start:326 stop:1108 length:783 start_codon:yes stop_codon:yes gene_type:complete
MELISKKIVSIVQARMGSTRLPGKVLMKIQDKPMLWHIINRIKQCDKVDDIIIATSNSKSDDLIYEMSKENGFICYRGSQNDVLDRFYNAAKENNADYIIRVTGDCPLIDSNIIKKLISHFFENRFDHCGVACGAGVANKIQTNKYPDGLDAEIFSFDVLKNAQVNANTASEREHVTPYIWKNKNFHTGALFPSLKDFSQYRLTVDNMEDFQFIKWIYDNLYPDNNNFRLDEIINLIEKNKKIIPNSHLIGQEGYDEFWE